MVANIEMTKVERVESADAATGLTQGFPECIRQHERAEGIDQHTYVHATARGLSQCLKQSASGNGVRKDVGLEIDRYPRLFNAADHGIEGIVTGMDPTPGQCLGGCGVGRFS